MFGRRQREIQEQIGRYCDTALHCAETFKRAMQDYCRDADYAAAKRGYGEVHGAESLADDIRRDVEVLMYSKALFPESRGDILGLLETLDRVPNHAEKCVRMIYEERILIPDTFRPEIVALVDVAEKSVRATVECVRKLFDNYVDAASTVGKIDVLESEADQMESTLKEQIFAHRDIEGFHKILLRDLVASISGVADRAERVGDRIRIIVAKRGI
jgi:hypothetical protein